MTTRYEFYFNEEYALEHNPALMCLGTTGGYGWRRAQMRAAIDNGSVHYARIHFFQLVQQTYKETAADAREIGCTVDDLLNQWHTSIISHPNTVANKEIRHYLRTVVMEDSPMDIHPDPMCIPTLATYKEWGETRSFAEDLRQYIEFVLEDGHSDIDPMDSTCIY